MKVKFNKIEEKGFIFGRFGPASDLAYAFILVTDGKCLRGAVLAPKKGSFVYIGNKIGNPLSTDLVYDVFCVVGKNKKRNLCFVKTYLFQAGNKVGASKEWMTMHRVCLSDENENVAVGKAPDTLSEYNSLHAAIYDLEIWDCALSVKDMAEVSGKPANVVGN